MKPKLAVSGYRGVWGDTLTPSIARDYAGAFAELILSRGGSTVVVGRDARQSGPELLKEVEDELLSRGLNVINVEMAPTPTVLFLVQKESAHGAIIITASHNPIEYNGLKFVTGTGAFTTEADIAEMETLRKNPPAKEGITRGEKIDGTTLFDKHLAQVLSHIDIPLLRARNFTIALDPINSVGATTSPKLFEKIGATYHLIHGEPTGLFAHEPEPLPKNLGDLQKLVLETKSDVGFAQDPDGDRLVLCDEKGNLLSEEMTLALCVEAVLSRTPGTIVINLSTSNMCEDIASSHGARTVRSKVGEANVTAKMRASGAIVGGEGGGGVIWPAVNPTRDSFVGMALVLELLARTKKNLSELAETLPAYNMVKEKASYDGDLSVLYAKMTKALEGGLVNTEDGLRLDFEDRSWIHVRPSNTEPVVRFIAEAKTRGKALELVSKARSCIEPN